MDCHDEDDGFLRRLDRVWKRLGARVPNGDVPLRPLFPPEVADPETQLAQDLADLLSVVKWLPPILRQLHLHRQVEELLKAACDAYNKPGKRIRERQASACRALGLTSGKRGRTSTAAEFAIRWIDLTLVPPMPPLKDATERDLEIQRRREKACAKIVKEFPLEGHHIPRRLRRIREQFRYFAERKSDLSTDDVAVLRTVVSLLSDPDSPANIPAEE